MFKALKPLGQRIFIFFKLYFFYQMCTIPFENWKLTLMIRREKGFELMISYYHFSTLGSNLFLTLKIIDFENVALIKVVHIHMIKGMNA